MQCRCAGATVYRTARSGKSMTRGLVLDDDLRRGALRAAFDLIEHTPGDVAIDRRVRPVRLGRDDGKPRVGTLADRHVQRDLAEERHAEPIRLLVRAAMPE